MDLCQEVWIFTSVTLGSGDSLSWFTKPAGLRHLMIGEALQRALEDSGIDVLVQGALPKRELQ